MNKWQKKIKQYGICGISCLFLMGMPLWYYLDEDEKISTQEQRSLQSFPDFAFSSFLDGTFQKELQQYAKDQLPQRQSLSNLQVKIEHQLGKQQFSDIWIGKDDWLFQEAINPSKAEIKKRSLAIQQFCKRYPKIAMKMLLVCNKSQIYSNYLPTMANRVDQEKLSKQFYHQISAKNLKTLDVTPIFKKQRKEYLYYASDHHWTTKGAYLAFQQFQQTFLKKTDTYTYKEYKISETFQGALAKTSGYQTNKKDSVTIFLPTKKTVETVVNYVEEQEKAASVYKYEKAVSANPYEVFLGGNHPLIEIDTSAANERSLLIFKDSFANAFIPFLLPYYHRITIVDARYYYDDIKSLMKDRKIDEVLFLYNVNTFFQDTTLMELLA